MLKPILVTSFYTIIAIQNSSCFIWICCKGLLVGLPTHTSLIFLKDSFQKAVTFTAYRSCSFLTPNSAGILNQEYGKASLSTTVPIIQLLPVSKFVSCHSSINNHHTPYPLGSNSLLPCSAFVFLFPPCGMFYLKSSVQLRSFFLIIKIFLPRFQPLNSLGGF